MFIIYGLGGQRFIQQLSKPFNFCMTPLKGSNKSNGLPKVTSKTMTPPPPLPTTAILPFISQNYEKDN